MLKKPVLLLIGASLLLAGCAAQTRNSSREVRPEPEDTLLYNTLIAEIAGHQGALQESVKHYREVVKKTNQLPLIRRAVRIMLFARDVDAADEAVHKWLKLTPENMEAHQIAATVALNKRDVGSALEHLEWVLQHSGEAGFKVISALLARDVAPEIALQAMKTMVINHDSDVLAHLVYANMAFNAGQYDAAITSSMRCIQMQPDNVEAHILLARAGIESGNVEQSLAELHKVVDTYPDDRELRLNYGRLLVAANRFESAVEQFKILIAQTPDNADLLYSTALVMMQIKNYTEAEQYLKRLLVLKSRSEEARYYLGRLEEDRKRYEQALGWYRQVKGPLYVDARMSEARATAKQGDINTARKIYKALREEYSDQAAKIWLGEGEMLRDLNQHQAAYDLLDKAVNELPDDMELLYTRALAADRIDRIDILERDLKNVLKNQPDHEHALNALGYTLADRTDRYLEALEYIKQALELAPTDPAIIDSMGWVQYRLGNIDKALEYLRRALDEYHDGEIAAHLGEVLWVSGDHKGATDVWERALSEFPDSQILLEVIRRFNPDI